MRFCMNNLLFSISDALDFIEKEVVGVETNHSKRVACLSSLMGKHFSLSDEDLSDLVGVALLHDNALMEYLQSEYLSRRFTPNEYELFRQHCILGETNVAVFPFFNDVKDSILYHHENADGSGVFKKKYDEIPLYARIVHFADNVDAKFNLCDLNKAKYLKIIEYIDENANILFDSEIINAFKDRGNYQLLEGLNDEHLNALLKQSVPYIIKDYTPQQLIEIASIIASIIDYKSTYTTNHSMALAQLAKLMGEYYQFDEETCAKLYLAGALHDIGKLGIDINILEKEDKLTEQEFNDMKQHVVITYDLLKVVEGFEDITKWATHHHEKLNGEGYPFGLNASDLSFNERLMACLDIYQALSEKRPYKEAIRHFEIMEIMNDLVVKGLLDAKIIHDIDIILREIS